MNRPSPPPARPRAVFTTGSPMRHVVVMAATGMVGLVAIFVVDLLSLLYISWLGDVNVTAGVGYATTALFFSTSTNIGMMIAVSATVSRALGASEPEKARRLAASGCLLATLLGAAVGAALMAGLGPLLTALGARGEAHDVAHRFLMICMPSNALMALGMSLGGVLRAVGDARRGMLVTLAGALSTAVIDPLLIFGVGLGPDGAAWAIVISRVVFCVVGWRGATRVHHMLARPTAREALADAGPIGHVAVPAILTNVATPVAFGFMMAVMSRFGDQAVAAAAITARLAPVAFGAVFALSGAIGPILGQNLGARLMDRVRQTLTSGLIFTLACVLTAWLVLALARDFIVLAFAASGETAELVRFYCLVVAGAWIAHGSLYVANAAFNNLGAPLLATGFNWGKATLGTIPFALAGAWFGGAKGAMLGEAAGGALFGVAAIFTAYGLVARLRRRAEEHETALRRGA
ncbi:MATE family efflux transporter [Alsobacter sp. SYSU M60028]|uniref:MATE family efflux transporter n=1 Tax=Alsobacter ponti TaxID=2962936 RepID=A0ABT1LEN2_9HYPH|nr:MATE family efflux transporter [Alsobacter ponti]MCP8939200.1 MATE family efflux transporter [Alsobacter ponti]